MENIMRSKVIFTFVAALILASVSMLPASASGYPSGHPVRPGQSTDTTPTPDASAPTCKDQKLIDAITTDAKAIGEDLDKIPSTGAGGVYTIMINIANTRLKYEDMTAPADPGCNYLVTETIVLFANVEDLGLIAMGTKLGLDTTADQPIVIARLEKQVKKVNDLIGVTSEQ
jgi:hypothetical protein